MENKAMDTEKLKALELEQLDGVSGGEGVETPLEVLRRACAEIW